MPKIQINQPERNTTLFINLDSNTIQIRIEQGGTDVCAIQLDEVQMAEFYRGLGLKPPKTIGTKDDELVTDADCRKIIEDVAREHGMTAGQLKPRYKGSDRVVCRRACAWKLRITYNLSLTKIAQLMGLKSPATIYGYLRWRKLHRR